MSDDYSKRLDDALDRQADAEEGLRKHLEAMASLKAAAGLFLETVLSAAKAAGKEIILPAAISAAKSLLEEATNDTRQRFSGK